MSLKTYYPCRNRRKKGGFLHEYSDYRLHCDAWRMQQDGYSFRDAQLDVTFDKLRAGHVMAQAFAIYIVPTLTLEENAPPLFANCAFSAGSA